MPYPSPYIVEPQEGNPHTYTVILLHGRGSTAKEFAADLFALGTEVGNSLKDIFPALRWVFPDAGLQWCTAFREERSAWFDTFSLDDLTKRQDLQVEGLRNSVQHVGLIVEQEIERLDGDSTRLVLGGFSQGSAVALWSMFTGRSIANGRIGAFIGLCAWIPFSEEVEASVKAWDSTLPLGERLRALEDTAMDILGLNTLNTSREIEACLIDLPIYLGNGTDDALINVYHFYHLTDILRALGSAVDGNVYAGAEREGHWIKEPEQITDVANFLTAFVALTQE